MTHPAWPAVATFINARLLTVAAPTWHGRLADPHHATEGGAYETIWICEHAHRTITSADLCAVREGRRRFGLRLPVV